MLADAPMRRPTRAVRVAALLTEKKLTLATAEAASAGTVAHRLTAIAGASAYFLGGVVAGDRREWPALGKPLNAPAGHVADELRVRLGADIGVCVGPLIGASGSLAVGMADEIGPSTEVVLRTSPRAGMHAVSNRILDVLERWLVARPTI
jgi:hypothetical protein